jgi:neutral ceramidase
MLSIGWGRVEITPAGSVPLAGYGHWGDRMSQRVRDPIFVRAMSFGDGAQRVVLLAYDLLLVCEDLSRGLTDRLADTGARLLVHATHTHSSAGGMVRGKLAEHVIGGYRPDTVGRLVDLGEQAARAALATASPGRVAASQVPLPGHNGNRRDPFGPMDEELTVVRLVREQDEAWLVSYSAHPVIVGERDHYALSADYPGALIERLEREVPFALFVQGALGGVDVLFPDDDRVTVDENLRLMVEPMARAVRDEVARLGADQLMEGPLGFGEREWRLPRPDSRPYYEDQPVFRRLGWPLKLTLDLLFKEAPLDVARVRGLRVGPFAMVGTPSDLGVSVALAGKASARESGIPCPVMASQSDGYIGYLHRLEDYRRAPRGYGGGLFKPSDYMHMGVYENALSMFGREAGEVCLANARRVFSDMADPQV